MERLFAGLTYNSNEILGKALKELEKEFGKIDFMTDEYDFSAFTDYYEDEMGEKLVKRFVFFKEELKESIADVKESTISIEKLLSDGGKRKINIDPGYINKSEMGLPSTKKLRFRKELKEGVYNQVIYTYDNGVKDAWGIFPDFKSEKVKGVFAKAFKSLQA